MDAICKSFVISGTPGRGERVHCLKHPVTNVRSRCLGDTKNMQFVFRVSLLGQSREANVKTALFVYSLYLHIYIYVVLELYLWSCPPGGGLIDARLLLE